MPFNVNLSCLWNSSWCLQNDNVFLLGRRKEVTLLLQQETLNEHNIIWGYSTPLSHSFHSSLAELLLVLQGQIISDFPVPKSYA